MEFVVQMLVIRLVAVLIVLKANVCATWVADTNTITDRITTSKTAPVSTKYKMMLLSTHACMRTWLEWNFILICSSKEASSFS